MKKAKKAGNFIQKIDNPKLFFFIATLLLISVLVIFVSLGRNGDLGDISQEGQTTIESNESDNDVSSLFEEEFARNERLDEESSIFGEDPFRESCAGLGDGETPVLLGFTACSP